MKLALRSARRLAGTAAGFSVVEAMIVATVFVLIAMSIYGTLTSLTKLQGSTDSNVKLQIEGQKALNAIIRELRTAGFYRPNPDQTLSPYGTGLWSTAPWDDPHTSWDVPYLFADEGAPAGVFGPLAHEPAQHSALPTDEEFQATREMCFVPLQPIVNPAGAAPVIASVNWSVSGLGAQSAVVMPIQWQLVSYELHTAPNADYNELRRVTRSVTQAGGANVIGPIVSSTVLANFVEAARFDTAQTDASLTLNTVKITIWLRKNAPSGLVMKAKVTSRVKLRNSI